MKSTRLILPALLLCAVIGCDNRKRDNTDDSYMNPNGASTAGGVVAPADNTRTFSDEVEDYRVRTNQRINQLENEIEEARRERKLEKDRKRIENYDDRIRDRELRRKTFQQRLDRLENQTEEGWENFKKEMDELFDNDEDLSRERGTRND